DGMESEIARDIGPGPRGEIFVATGRGTGRYDGARWTFPRLGAFYHPGNALGHDARGNVFIGTDKGLFCVGACPPDAIDTRRGLPPLPRTRSPARSSTSPVTPATPPRAKSTPPAPPSASPRACRPASWPTASCSWSP